MSCAKLALSSFLQNTRLRYEGFSGRQERMKLVQREGRSYENRFGGQYVMTQPSLLVAHIDRNLRSTLFLSKLTSLEHQRCLGRVPEIWLRRWDQKKKEKTTRRTRTFLLLAVDYKVIKGANRGRKAQTGFLHKNSIAGRFKFCLPLRPIYPSRC